MERIYHNYLLWEDYKNGLYEIGIITDEKILNSLNILTNQDLFWDVMCQMQIDWKFCFEQNLSNTEMNRLAWLGQASCCYETGNEFNITIRAWHLMNDIDKKNANNTAQMMVNLYEEQNGKNRIKYECSGRCERTINMDF